jgi:adenylosuccinate lyase
VILPQEKVNTMNSKYFFRQTTVSLRFILTALLFFPCAVLATEFSKMDDVYTQNQKNQYVLDIEAAMARAQANLGIIPDWAAREITSKADIKFAPADELKAEYDKVRHRMVAMLNVWTSKMANGAGEYAHFGATTVDIYDTVKILQIKQSILLLIKDLRALELTMIEMATAHRTTPMIGRTLGQHALPITFGKKVSVWIGENRRNIERLKDVLGRVNHSGILKGAVGSYLGLGEKAIQVEEVFAKELGLDTPYPSDWHGTRDVYAEYANTLALISKSYGRIGTELWMLQMTDIGETVETRPKSAVGSSTMPHKINPSKSEALIQFSRSIPRLAEIIQDDVINYFERDNTSRPNKVVKQISIETADMLKQAKSLIGKLQIKSQIMRANLDKTHGLIMAQRVTFALADSIGKTTANAKMHEVASFAWDNDITLKQAIEHFPEISRYFTDKQLADLMDVTTYIGLAPEQVDRVIAHAEKLRETDPKT